MPSALYEGWVRHQRDFSIQHRFQYRVFMALIDLDDIDTLEDQLVGFSTKRFYPIQLRAEDHGVQAGQSIRTAIADRLNMAGVGKEIGRIELLTNLRSFGHCFNPISIYFCYSRSSDDLEALILEVSNTPWNERHWYILPVSTGSSKFIMNKTFHVSPFLPMNMHYEVYAKAPGDRVQLAVSNFDETRLAHRASLVLRRRVLSSGRLWGMHMRYFFHTRQTLLRIHWQALKLWQKGARFHKHPDRQIHDS